MPLLKIHHVTSFSSEDQVHVANNLLGNNTSLKWKCKTPGEKSAIIFFQLEKASKITGIDIGNEHSAYIEVLVSRMGDDDYKTLLVMSSFMSASDSRQSQNKNQIRMFKKEDLSQPECNEKWDRIKVVCTQPFNKHVQYGLSFIKFHTDEPQVEINSKENVELEVLKPGSLFAKWKQNSNQKEKLTAAAAIRATTSSLLNCTDNTNYSPKTKLLPDSLKILKNTGKNSNSSQNEIELKPRNRKEILYTEDDEKQNDKIDSLVEKKRLEKLQNSPKVDEVSEKKKPSKLGNGSKVEVEKRESLKRKQIENDEISRKKPKVKISKPFNKLLQGVTLVISGIQNPDRANLRTYALEMGAKYKPDWDNTCTHLICAFMNTPKFNQVKGKGKIVTRQWIETCHEERKRIPWRRFALDKSDKNQPESEDEIIFEEIQTPENGENTSNIPSTVTTQIDDETMEQASDTEDIIERLAAAENQNQNKENDPFSIETESSGDEGEPQHFFEGKKFVLGFFDSHFKRKLERYITMYKGELSNVSDNDYIICKKEEILQYKNEGICILPEWIVDCHKSRRFIAPDEYFIL